MIKEPIDIDALALERYPQPEQGGERAAFIEGFLAADPGRAIKNPERDRRRWGTLTGLFRSMEIGQTMQVPMVDSTNWSLMRTTASHLRQVYGCRFSVSRDRKDRTMLNIHRYE